MPETVMDKITTEMAEHICDNICRFPLEKNETELEEICSDCKMAKFIWDIINEYRRKEN